MEGKQMDWIKIYRECEKMGGRTFKVIEGAGYDDQGLPTHKTISTYPMGQIKVKAFDQLIQKVDVFSAGELRFILDALHQIPKSHCPEGLSDKVWGMYTTLKREE